MRKARLLLAALALAGIAGGAQPASADCFVQPIWFMPGYPHFMVSGCTGGASENLVDYHVMHDNQGRSRPCVGIELDTSQVWVCRVG